jgi:uncharacterized protein
MEVNRELREYIEREIIPRYDGFDAAHRRDHVMMVIEQSLALAEAHNLDIDMAYAIAAYHDVGLVNGREYHHSDSKRIMLADRELLRWFTSEQIAMMADAAEDHRASSKSAPRTIYGRIVAEADRVIDSETIIRRTIQYTLANHPTLNREEGYERMMEHLHEKYDYGGYLKLWIEGSKNEARLEELRQLIAQPDRLREIYERIYDEEAKI